MKFLKNNFLIIIIFTFLTSFIVFEIFDYKHEYELMANNEKMRYSEKCIVNTILNKEEVKLCNTWKLNLEERKQPEFFTSLSEILNTKFAYLDILAFVILIIPSILMINQILKDQVLINILTKESYSKFLKKLFTKIYRYIWLFPTLLIILICLLLTFTKIDFDAGVNFQYYILTEKPISFLISYVLNSILLSSIYLNISLISLRYKHNYVISCITSFIIYLSIILFFEIGLDFVIFEHTLNLHELRGLFSITNIFNYNISDTISPITRVLISFMFFIISSLIIYFCYKNKEKLIIDCEKNNREEL